MPTRRKTQAALKPLAPMSPFLPPDPPALPYQRPGEPCPGRVECARDERLIPRAVYNAWAAHEREHGRMVADLPAAMAHFVRWLPHEMADRKAGARP